MLWANEKKRLLRAMMLGLILIALMGPWVFETIHVPREFPCSDPFIRLEGDYCGDGLSGIWILLEITRMVAGVVTGALVLNEVLQGFLLLTLLVLPILSTLLLLLRGDRSYLLVFHLLALILALATIFLTGLLSYPRFSWVVWGVWLYVGVAAIALILEGAFLATKGRPGQP